MVMKKTLLIILTAAFFTINTAADPVKVTYTVEQLEMQLQDFTETVYAQIKSEAECTEIYAQIKQNIENSNIEPAHVRNYLLAQNEYLAGKAYQLFDDPETVIAHNRKMRGGGTSSLTKYYSDKDIIRKHHEKAIDYLDKSITESPNANNLKLRGLVLGDYILIRNIFYLMVNGPKVSKYVEKALDKNPYDTRARIIDASAKVYPTKIFGGNPEKAIEMLSSLLNDTKYSKSKDELFDIYSGIGYCYARLTKYKEANEYILKSLNIFPDNNFANGILKLIELKDF